MTKSKLQLAKGISITMMIVYALLSLASRAFASEYEMFYLSEKGKRIEPIQALVSATKGDKVFKCQSVESKISKTGTSINLKNVKKPKS